MKRCLTFVCLMMFATAASADWEIDPESSYIGFASVKNEVIAEQHHFTGLSGGLSANGRLAVIITLASVETLIPIRNERMLTMLFNIAEFPLALVTGVAPLDEFLALEAGQSARAKVALDINLHGQTVAKTVLAKVIHTGGQRYEVASLEPVMLHAAEFKLEEGVAALREVAGLQSIDMMVPVVFALTFTKR